MSLAIVLELDHYVVSTAALRTLAGTTSLVLATLWLHELLLTAVTERLAKGTQGREGLFWHTV